jgi:hypothetical protein
MPWRDVTPAQVRLCASVKSCGHKCILPVCHKDRILLFVIRTLIQTSVWCMSRRASLFTRSAALSVVVVYHYKPPRASHPTRARGGIVKN